jgi:AcrR family transcriptional regulator
VSVKPHDRILATATRLFLREGIKAVGMTRIASEADVAPMTIYRQFGDKDRLVAAVVEHSSTKALQSLAADEIHGSLMTSVATELRASIHHPARKAVEAHRLAMQQLLEDLTRRVGAVDPPRLAAQLQFLVEGAMAATMVDQWPAGADGVRALADAALAAGSAR